MACDDALDIHTSVCAFRTLATAVVSCRNAQRLNATIHLIHTAFQDALSTFRLHAPMLLVPRAADSPPKLHITAFRRKVSPEFLRPKQVHALTVPLLLFSFETGPNAR